MLLSGSTWRKWDHIPDALVRTLVMKMGRVLRERMPESTLAKQDELLQRLLFDRSHPALGIDMQMRRPRWEWHTVTPASSMMR